LAYVLLKIAMEIQDKSSQKQNNGFKLASQQMPLEIEGTDEKRPLSVDPPKEKPVSNIMQRLRFRRYA
jgi:hypothetical protein